MSEFSVSSEVAEDFDALAEYLAYLSERTTFPKGVAAGQVEPFGHASVDFTSSRWLAQLASVQGWLHFPASMPLDEPQHALSALAGWLGLEGASVSDVLDALSARASTARHLAERFVEAVEDGDGAVDAATQGWEEGWDEFEATEEDRVEPEPLIAEATTWYINDFSSRAQQDKLNLAPSYQRSDVWPLSDRQLLIQSILRGIPLPSVILLKPKSAALPFEVVDGKQRITTILRFVGKHPAALALVKERAADAPDAHLEELFASDYPKFRKVWKNVFGENLTSTLESQYYFPFKLPANSQGLPVALGSLSGKYYTQMRDDVIQVGGSESTIRNLFEQSGEYKVPLILYTGATQRQIHEVFNLYNKQGKHLNAEEIRNAIYHELELTRASLLAAGDANAEDVRKVSPALDPIWDEIADLGSSLESFNFGTSRYKRTKVLMWAIALLVLDTRTSDGKYGMPSTAQHINALLARVQDHRSDPLRDQSVLRDLFVTAARSVEVHHGLLDWPQSLGGRDQQDSSGDTANAPVVRWQELPLVGTLVAMAAAVILRPDDYEEVLEECGEAIYAASSSDRLSRPQKTQTGVQWKYLARIVTDLLAAMNLSPEDAAEAVETRFGSTGLHVLVLIADELPDGPVS